MDLVTQMNYKSNELQKHFKTIKQAAFEQGRHMLRVRQRQAQSYERAYYGSNFKQLGICKSGSIQRKSDIDYTKITEQQFLYDQTSDEEEQKQEQVTNEPVQQVLDMNFDEKEQEILDKKVYGKDIQQVAEAYIYQQLQNIAKNSLNQEKIKNEIYKERSKQKIERLRWNYSNILNVQHSGFFTGTGRVVCNNPQQQTEQNQENIFTTSANGGKDVQTLSLFCRPQPEQFNYVDQFYRQDGTQQYFYGSDAYKLNNINNTVSLFNKRQSNKNEEILQKVLEEQQKKFKPKAVSENKKQQQKNKKKKDIEEKSEEKPKTRDDISIMSELFRPFKGEKHQYRIEQLKEIQDLKQHLNKNQLNISADVLEKAIILPEELTVNEVSYRKYPLVNEMLFENPFPKVKKGKKGKKNKKK